MSQSPDTQVARRNYLLAGLPVEDSNYLQSSGRVERLPQGYMLCTRAEPATSVWFPDTAVIALTITDHEGRTVQTGVVGAEGCIGLEALHYPTPALAGAQVQVSGELLVIPAARLQSALALRPAIQAAFSRFLYYLSVQSLQTIACNRLHNLESRCCRWLLMMQDRTGSDDLPLTQECLAMMLGSGRPRINVLLASLEQAGLVRRFRGGVRLQSRFGLEQRACECYRLIQYPPRLTSIS